MKIVQCPQCGKKLHNTNKCLFCGNSNGFLDIEQPQIIHENAREEYLQLEELLLNKSYDKMLEMSKMVLQWMPTKSEVFWYRVLAKHQCSNDAELVQKGIDFEYCADYYNAKKYASPDELETYGLIVDLVNKIQNAFAIALVAHEYEEKNGTSILRAQIEFNEEINRRRIKLFDLWSQLENTEQQMYCTEEECKLLMKEHLDVLKMTKTETDKIKSHTYMLNECTGKQLLTFQIQLGNALSQSNQSKHEINAMKNQHPWIAKFEELKNKRNELCGMISSELASLKSYETRIQSTVSEIERIEKRHQLANKDLSEFKFQSMYSLLGKHNCEEIYTSVGFMGFTNNYNASNV